MNDKKHCVITLCGCDDYTEINIDLDQKEIELIEKIALMSCAESKYQCMPTLEIREVDK